MASSSDSEDDGVIEWHGDDKSKIKKKKRKRSSKKAPRKKQKVEKVPKEVT